MSESKLSSHASELNFHSLQRPFRFFEAGRRGQQVVPSDGAATVATLGHANHAHVGVFSGEPQLELWSVATEISVRY